MTVDTPGQEVLDRTAVVMTRDALEARFTIALPASGRTVLGQMAYRSIIEMLPQYVQQVKRIVMIILMMVRNIYYYNHLLQSLHVLFPSPFLRIGSSLPSH